MRAGLTGAFGVSGEIDNGRRVVEFCTERGCVWVTYFEHKRVDKYTRVARSEGREHDRSVVGEEEYAALCAECEGSERNGARPLKFTCCTV